MRFKGICSECSQTITCLITSDSDKEALEDLEEEENLFEYQCPACGGWATFKVIAVYPD